MNQLHGNFDFYQYINGYFVRDDILYPVVMLIFAVMCKAPSLETFLWGISVAASALMYRYRAPINHNWKTNRNLRYTKNTLHSQKSPLLIAKLVRAKNTN